MSATPVAKEITYYDDVREEKSGKVTRSLLVTSTRVFWGGGMAGFDRAHRVCACSSVFST